MRTLLTLLLLLSSLALTAQGAITVSPGVPVSGAPTTFVLSPTYPPIGPVSWDFGDQSVPLSGGTVASHIYARTGSYVVRATYPFGSLTGIPATVQLPIRVADRLGPAAPFTISMLRLRWEDGRVDTTVEQGFSPLAAYADLKFEGTGHLQAQWVVDGIPLSTFTAPLAFAGAVTLDSRSAIPLPTTDYGEHRVTLRILSPAMPFESPQIRYFVRLGGEEAPQVDDVVPAAARSGEETELRIRGRRLAPGMALSFGKDVALVAPLRFPEPGWAIARVFVSPTARPGFREVQAFSKAGRSRGPARLEVLPRPRQAAAAGPAPAQPSPLVAFLWSEGEGVARPSLLRALTAAFLPPGEEDPLEARPGLFQAAMQR
ncbi:PKD domain-containing protein [Geothrix terrae]|uniref:PKD domain-containing protein n=1 Tax=Geothrix terrae TaxID=2922720 RepID=UPI001FAD614D|nr:PKD domain-containing protein [Geothrix terrae]